MKAPRDGSSTTGLRWKNGLNNIQKWPALDDFGFFLMGPNVPTTFICSVM